MNRIHPMLRNALIPTAALLFAAISAGEARAQPYKPVGFEVLGAFEMEIPDPLDPKPIKIDIPPSIQALDGKRISVKGFILPLDLDTKGVSRFMLNASLDMCYFGAPVRYNDWVMVTMKGGKKAKFTHLPTQVSGLFSVGKEMKNGRVVSIYRLLADEAVTVK